MATFKAEVYAHQKKADGTYNIKIRVTQNMRKKYLSTPWYVTREDLTRSLKLKNQKYIDLTDDLIKKYRSRCDRVGEAIKTMTVEQVVEIQSAVVGSYQDTEHVRFKTVPPIQIASATYKGSYEQISRVNKAVADWVAANGYDFDGKSFCIYHVSPSQTDDPEELVTEVCFPVRKK